THTAEPRAALIEVIDVGEDRGARVIRFERDENRLAETIELLRESPDLDRRHDAEAFGCLEKRAVTFGGAQALDVLDLARRRRRDVRRPDGVERLHERLRLVERSLPRRLVVDHPLKERDRARDAKPFVVEELLEIAQLAAGLFVVVELVRPRLDA